MARKKKIIKKIEDSASGASVPEIIEVKKGLFILCFD